MAFSQSIKRGQIPVYCRLCETETKITSKCIDCDLLMCTKCKDKIHPKFKNAKNHRIVDIKDVGPDTDEGDLQEMDFTNIKCQTHSGQTSCMFCKSCDQLVCSHCISKVHNGHGLVDIKEGYEIQTKKLGTTEKKVSRNLDEYNERELKIKEKEKAENSKYQDVKKRIQEQNTILKKAVDQYTDDLLNKLDKNWEDVKTSINSKKQETTEKLIFLKEKKSLIENLRKSHDAEMVFSEVHTISKSTEIDAKSLELKFDSIPVFIPGEISPYNFGQLNQSTSIADITISKCYTTNLEVVSYISVNNDNSLWIGNNIQGLLMKVKPVGDNISIISSYNIKVWGIALTPSNDILLATEKSTLQMISQDSGQLKDTNYTVAPLDPIVVHVNSHNKVIVGGKKGGKGAVIVMDMEGKHEMKYKHDRNNEPLFTYPRQITSTRNRNIFVIDKLSHDSKGRVVILQQTGDIVNIYRGHPHINDDNRPFKPLDMACKPSDNIIVTDLDTDTIHVLNNTGYLIKYCNMEDLGILCPCSLAFNTSGKLYIGCTRQKSTTKKKSKLYEVKISGF